jgi:hypothetical protein
VPRARAKVKIVASYPICGGNASVPAVRGAVSRGVIRMPKPRLRGCSDTYTETLIAAHELGHVLGLDHQEGRCATMNAGVSRHGGQGCRFGPLWKWRCRIVEPDDIKGAVAIYGGRARPASKPARCDTYRQPPALTALTATADESGNITVSFRRPENTRIPAFLLVHGRRNRDLGFAYSAGRNRCSRPEPYATPYSVAPGRTQAIGLYEEGTAGERICITAQTRDAFGRPGKSASVWVEIPPPSPEFDPSLDPQAGL